MPFANTGFDTAPSPNTDNESLRVVDNAATENDPYTYDKIKSRVSRLSKKWKDEKAATDERRNLRYSNVDCKSLRAQGRLKPDEIYIPIRIINDNITKEAPQYIAYLSTSRNAAVFKARTPTKLPMQVVEKAFTDMVRFPGWELPFFKNLDGTQTHGWSCVEVVFDADKPGHFGIEDIAHENLWFADDLESLQKGPELVRNCKVTREELERFVDGNKDQIEMLFKDRDKEEGKLEATQEVQKVFYRNRNDGLIYVCWVSYENGTDFLRPPKPLWLGKVTLLLDPLTQQVKDKPKKYETQYPIELFPYVISENGKLTTLKGRAFYDEYVQEAAGSLVSSIVNAWYRASQVMGAPTNPTSAGAPEETDIVISGGKIYSEPIEFFHMPYPDASGMAIVQALVTQNKSETSQVNFAVNNRQDSRKTAREITAAQSQASLLSGVQVTLYSIFLRNVWTRCWAIAKSQLEQGLITDVTLGQEYLALEYTLFSAGDSEVIQRDEQLQKLQQSWPVFQNTPAASIILQAIVDLAFPTIAEEINAALQGTNPANIVAALSQVIQGFIQEFPTAIQPQDMEKLKGVLMEAQQYLNQNQPTEEGKPHGEPIPNQGSGGQPTQAGQAQPGSPVQSPAR